MFKRVGSNCFKRKYVLEELESGVNLNAIKKTEKIASLLLVVKSIEWEKEEKRKVNDKQEDEEEVKPKPRPKKLNIKLSHFVEFVGADEDYITDRAIKSSDQRHCNRCSAI